MRAADVRIRAFIPSDYESLIALWRVAGLTIKPSDTLAELVKLCAHPSNRLLIAESSNQTGEAAIVGAVIGAYDGRRAWIYHLAVTPGFQRNGIASRLMHAIEQHLKATGAIKLNLLVEPGNKSAQAFYQSRGFSYVPFHFFTKEL